MKMEDEYNGPFENEGLTTVCNSIKVVKIWVFNLNELHEIQDSIYQERMVQLAKEIPKSQTSNAWEQRHKKLLFNILGRDDTIDKMWNKSDASKRAFDTEKLKCKRN